VAFDRRLRDGIPAEDLAGFEHLLDRLEANVREPARPSIP
jgi:hypothetical protein